MKFLVLLLPLYLVLLSCLPCRDGYEDAGEGSIISQADDAGHHHQSENCTPFCTCSCCSITSIPGNHSQKQITTQEKVLPEMLFTDRTSYLPNQYLQSIWQPPRCN